MNETVLENEVNTFKPIPELVERIAKSATAVFYDSLTTKNVLCENKRLDVIGALKDLCRNGGKHFKIDETNYDCYVEIITNAFDSSDVQSLDDDFTLKDLDVTTSIVEFNNRIKDNVETKSKFMEIIRQRDRQKYADDLTFDSSFFSREKSDFLQNSIILETINNMFSCKKQSETQKYVKVKTAPYMMRTKQVTLAYALLNLSKTGNNNSLLNSIINKLSLYSTFTQDELQLIDYLWKSCDEASEMLPSLLEKFPFIYEKKFIKLCKIVLSQEETHFGEILADCKAIMKVGSKNKHLLSNIANLMYQLFAFSNYNKFLYNFLRENNFI